MNSRVLKALRVERNLTQAEFAKKMKISRSAYESYENARRFPDISIIIKIANFYEVPFFKLLANEYLGQEMCKQIMIIKKEAERTTSVSYLA